ncbi:MAG: hypothetical protein C3F07_17765 [Anaerolineales bacterium]|nr:MAG: hypothetical protein C3F07_17765 [Anaerolineales bacterium]
MKRIPWFEIILVIAVMSMSLYAALSDAQNLSMRWFIRDDAYYYYKVAQNISEGHGSTFDGVNPTNGYHPLWLWICIPIFALARFDLILPLRILLLVMSGLSAATAILMYRLIGKVFTPAIGAIAAVYWVFSRDVLDRVYKQGLETGIAAFFLMLFIYKLFEFERAWRQQPISRKQLTTLAILAVLVMFSRLDLVFLAGLAGIWIIFRRTTVRYLLPLDVVSIILSVLLALILRITFDNIYKYSQTAVYMIALSLAIKIPGAYFLGLYQSPVLSDPRKFVTRLTVLAVSSSAVAGVIMIVLTPLAHFEGFPRTVIFYDMALTVLFLGLPRMAYVGLKTSSKDAQTGPLPLQQFSANWKTWLNEGLIYYGIVFGALAAYMVWNKIAFGTFSPVSGQIKRWWGSLSGNVYGGAARSLLSYLGIDYVGEANAWHPASTIIGEWAEKFYKMGIMDYWRYTLSLTLFALVFYLILLSNKQKAKNAVLRLGIIPLLASAWVQVLSYHITGYSAYKEWYWVSQSILIVLTLSLIAGMLYYPLHKYPAANLLVWAIAFSVAISMGSSFWKYIQHVMPYGRTPSTEPYNEISAFLEEHTEPGSVIGMTGGGNAGYFISDRTVVNMDGLINSAAYFELLKKRQAGAYLSELGMDYVLANAGLLDQLPYKGQFDAYLDWTGVRYGGKELMKYHSSVP